MNTAAASEIHPRLRLMNAADGFRAELEESRDLLARLNREPLARQYHSQITLRIRSINKQLADAGVQP